MRELKIGDNVIFNQMFVEQFIEETTGKSRELDRYQKIVMEGIDQIGIIKEIDLDSLSKTMSFNYDLLLSFIENNLDFRFFPISWEEADQISNAKNLQVFFEGLQILFLWKLGRSRKSQDFQSLVLPKEITV